MADSIASNGHIDSLIDYVVDTKPYHTKLSEIVEEYLFNDEMSVTLQEEIQKLVILGSDYVNASGNPFLKVWANTSVRPNNSLTANKIVDSDGIRTLYQIPSVLRAKPLSFSLQHTFTAVTAPTSIPGLDSGVFSIRNYFGPGIPSVKKNGVNLVESVDYHISQGAFTFTTNGTTWTPNDVTGITDFTNQSGTLAYDEVISSHGWIKNISCSNTNLVYEEWTLTWNGTGLDVVGSSSGHIGVATQDVPFVNAKINFTYTLPPSTPDTENYINVGDKFVLTPTPKICVHTTAPAQTWSLIKVNPIAITAGPTYTGSTSGGTPSISLYSWQFDNTAATTFTITFTSSTNYTITSALSGYPVNRTIGNGVYSYKDSNLHFTINPNGHTFQSGDHFSFTIGSSKSEYKVFGSVSGWQANATVGKWYDNGKIAFKVPSLTYWPCYLGDTSTTNSLTFTANAAPHVGARPSVYVIKFVDSTHATVFNNISGYGPSLTAGQAWTDGVASFTISGTFSVGEQLAVYLTELDYQAILRGYDEDPYDMYPYDVPFQDVAYPKNLLQEHIPLVHSQGAVIIPNVSDGDAIIIDKIEFESMRLKIGADSIVAPVELGANSNWVPLEFRNSGVFPDYSSTVSAYLAANSSVKVFDISQSSTNFKVPTSAVSLTFDSDFVADYLPASTQITMQFHKQANYEQTAAVKMSESLHIQVNSA